VFKELFHGVLQDDILLTYLRNYVLLWATELSMYW